MRGEPGWNPRGSRDFSTLYFGCQDSLKPCEYNLSNFCDVRNSSLISVKGKWQISENDINVRNIYLLHIKLKKLKVS